MLAQLAGESVPREGLRPLNPLRDLTAVTDLVEMVFGAEEDFTGAETIAEMRRWASRLPLLLLLAPLESIMGGFVWEQEGRIVGNVSTGRLHLTSDDWMISNVAVHPDYRRQGIGRQLVTAALDAIVRQGGEYAVLQVREDNETALRLYQSLGFATFATTLELQREPRPQESVPAPAIPGARAYTTRYRRWVTRLINGLLPPDASRFRPLVLPGGQMVREGRWENWLSDLLERKRTKRMVVVQGGQPAGFLAAQARLRRHAYHRLFVATSPGGEGPLEQALVQQGLAWLSRYPHATTLINIPATSTLLYDALLAWGFRETRRLENMKLRIPERR